MSSLFLEGFEVLTKKEVSSQTIEEFEIEQEKINKHKNVIG